MESKALNAALAAKDTATDGAYIMAQDANGNTVRIAKADLASVLAEHFLPLKLGTGNIGGEILIQSKYSKGPLAVVGTTYAQGGLYIGYGVENKNDKWFSTTSATLRHCALVIDSGKLKFGTVSASTATPIGEEVTLTFREL